MPRHLAASSAPDAALGHGERRQTTPERARPQRPVPLDGARRSGTFIALYNRTVATDAGRFRDLTLGVFVDRLASLDPVPGGGSASAVVAGLAAGLVVMVAVLSQDRPKYAAHAATHAAAAARGGELADRLLALADEDARAYADFAACRKMARETEHERALRASALRRAARTAASVPLDCVAACLEVVDVAESLAGRSNANAASDLAVATLLAEAAAQGAAANVLVNLPAIEDEEFASVTSMRVAELLSRIAAQAAVTGAVVASGELREPLATPAA